jgi:mRNA-binding protein PUF3
MDAFSRLSQAPRHGSSFSLANGRTFQERSGSMQSDSFQALGRINYEQEPESRMASHRASMSTTNIPSAFASGEELGENFNGHTYLSNAGRMDAGSYTPDTFPSSQLNGQLRSHQFDSGRSAVNGTSVRQSPMYSHSSTPLVYDRLNPYSSEQNLAHPNNVAQLQNKLAGVQLSQQGRRNFILQTNFISSSSNTCSPPPSCRTLSSISLPWPTVCLCLHYRST